MFLFASLASGIAFGRTCTWNAGSAGSFSSSGNWSCTSGSGPPTTSDAAVFDGSSTRNCSIGSSITLTSLSINSGYTGTITQSSSQTITTSGAFTKAGTGTFTGGNTLIDVGGDFNLSAGTFTSTSGLLQVGGAFNKTGGTFSANSGEVMLNAASSKTFATNGATFNDLFINDGLVGYWKLDEASTGTAVDSSGYGYDAAHSNSPTVSAVVPTTSFLDARSLSFTMSDREAVIINPMPVGLELPVPMTISLWYKATAVDSSGSELVSGLDAYTFRLKSSGLELIKYNGSTWIVLTATLSTHLDGNWHHVAAVLSGSAMTIYFDGASVASNSDGTGLSYSGGSGTTFAIGRHAGSNTAYDFGGNMDEVRVYSRALNATEVSALAVGNQPGTSAATQTVTGSPTISGDLVIAAGTLALGSNALALGGSWLNYGGLFSGTGAVTLNGSGTGNVIRSASQSFADVTVSGSGTWTLADRMEMLESATLTTNAGTFALSSYTFRGGDIARGAGTFSPGTGSVVLNSSTSEALDPGTFNTLRIEDATESNLVGYWKLDAGQGTSLRDFSGTGNTGTLVNGASWVPSSGVPATIAFDNPAAISLDGSNDHATLGVTSLPALNASKTVSFWIYYASVPASSQNFLVLKSGTGLLQIGFRSSAIKAWNSGGAILGAASSTPSSGWHHVAYSWNGTTNKFYFDGGTPGTSATSPNTGAVTNAYLGTYDGTNEMFAGKIDDVRIYDTALTDAQAASLAAGRYPNAGGTSTYTLGYNTTVTGTFALDSGSFATSSYTINASSASSMAYVNAGTYTVGSTTNTFAGGLTVQPQGTLTLATSGGKIDIGSAKSLVMNGTLNASSTGATIESGGGASTYYSFSVGSTSTATPTINITGLAVKNTDTNGMYINSHTSASTTFTRFDNIAFSSGTGNSLLQIYAASLNLTASACTFDTGVASGTTVYNVKLTGNGTADGETRAMFGGSTCATNKTPCSSYKQDNDANADGVGDTAASNAAVVQFMRAGTTDTSGTNERFPVAAFDWSTFTYYSTYVLFHDVDGGTADRIYVRDSSGTAKYSWDTPSTVDLVGSPRFDTSGLVHYVYAATSAGKIYRLIDSGSSLAQDNTGNWAGANNPYDCSCTITTPLVMSSGTTLYWGGVAGAIQKVWTLGIASRTLAASSPITVGATIADAAPAIWTSGDTYLFLGMNAHFYKIDVTTQSGTTDNTNPTGAISGRLAVASSKIFGADAGGTLWALDPTNFANTNKLWSYHDDTNHLGCTSGACSITCPVYVDVAATETYYGDQDGHVYVIKSDGTARSGFPWRPAGLATNVFATAPLYRSGVIAIGTTDGTFYLIDRDTGSGSPGLIATYNFGSGHKVSGISYDSSTSSYLFSVASDSSKDGKLYYVASVSDTTSPN